MCVTPMVPRGGGCILIFTIFSEVYAHSMQMHGMAMDSFTLPANSGSRVWLARQACLPGPPLSAAGADLQRHRPPSCEGLIPLPSADPLKPSEGEGEGADKGNSAEGEREVIKGHDALIHSTQRTRRRTERVHAPPWRSCG